MEKAKRRLRGKPFVEGDKRINRSGSPKRGESWAEIVKRVGNMTPSEAAAESLVLAKQLLKYGEGITLKEAVVLRVYGALLFEPNAGLLNALMDRAEGKPTQNVTVQPSEALLRALKDKGLTLEDVRADPLAANLFALAGYSVGVSAGEGEPNSTEQTDQD